MHMKNVNGSLDALFHISCALQLAMKLSSNAELFKE